MMLQLNPPLPMDTPKGIADAHFVIDYGSEGHILFVTFVRCSGECWTWQARECQLEKNVTGGIRSCTECENKQAMIDGLEEALAESREQRDTISLAAERCYEQLKEARQAVAVLKRQAEGVTPAEPKMKYPVGCQVFLDGNDKTTLVVGFHNPDGTYGVRSEDGDVIAACASESRLSDTLPF
jgi:hypothetical protein